MSLSHKPGTVVGAAISRTPRQRRESLKLLGIARIASIPVTIGTLHALAQPVSASTSVDNSGFYDHQIIEYQATPEVTSSPQAAQLISHGNVVYHIVGADGTTPAVQCARLLAALPNDASSCNVLNFIPTEVGYAGGAWNLQIFHWNPGISPVELSKDDDILAAVAAGKGALEVTPTLVRCPVINFAALR